LGSESIDFRTYQQFKNGEISLDTSIAIRLIEKFEHRTDSNVEALNGSYEDFLDALGFMESSDNYQATTPSGTYMGRYQLGPTALQDAGFLDKDGNWTEVAKEHGVTNKESFLNSPKAQEVAIRSYHTKVWGYITNAGLDDYVGKEFHGVTVTESGLLAAGHLVGVYGKSGIISMFETGIISYDGNDTAATTYMENYGGYSLDDLLK
jgi:hypothetical protein